MGKKSKQFIRLFTKLCKCKSCLFPQTICTYLEDIKSVKGDFYDQLIIREQLYKNRAEWLRELNYKSANIDELDKNQKSKIIASEVFINSGENDIKYKQYLDDIIKTNLENEGIEALAFYIPFHFSPYLWGIYIKEDGINYLANNMRLKLTPKSTHINVYREYVYSFLLDHEFFHFIEELAFSFLELKKCKAHFLNDYNEWKPYNKKSEALANAYALKRIKNNSIKKFMIKQLQEQPSGYKDFRSVINNIKLNLFQRITTEVGDFDYYKLFKELKELRRNRLNLYNVPTYLVYSSRISNSKHLKFITSFSKIHEERKYKKNLNKLHPVIRENYLNNILPSLRRNIFEKGVNFEKLNNNLWSFRINSGNRVFCRYNGNGELILIDVGGHDLYKFYKSN